MRKDVKQAANTFLLETYNFPEETRARLLEKATREILLNCQQLLSAISSGEKAAPTKCAHRLKSNLNALGLVALVQEAKSIEANTFCSGKALLGAAMNLRDKITDKPCSTPT
ncbi:MAG: hypothetical protein ACP59X_01135 [Solidesulfovibrio sp. DCME]|uniref:hypothetical protein n=1 Tax=Solidesulfovibrio sp. DCME TaxID=3447380 RepID=UPI003D0DDCE4